MIKTLRIKSVKLKKYINSKLITIVNNSMTDSKYLNSSLKKKIIKHLCESVTFYNYKKKRSNRIIAILRDTIK